MSVILRPNFPAPPRIPVSGANAADVEKVKHSVGLIFDLTIGALQDQLERLRENLPADQAARLPTKELYAMLNDVRSDYAGWLSEIAENVS